MSEELIERLVGGHLRALESADARLRRDTAENGQHPYAIVIACSDSRVIPEQIFNAGLGELFVIRVAGNVLDRQQLGSVEYAAAHLGCKLVVVLGHSRCGAIGAALSGESDGYIRSITDEIQLAIGETRDPDEACRKNVGYAVRRLRQEFGSHPEICQTRIVGAVYDIADGSLKWLED